MADINQSSWSETDASNNQASPNGWTSGSMLPSQVEPTARGMMGAIKRWFNRIQHTQTSGGTANAHTLTYSIAPTGLVAGDTYSFKAGTTNTGATTLNVNGLGATAVQVNGNALTGGELRATRYHKVVYDGTNFQLQDPAAFYPGLFNTPMKGGVQSGTTAWAGFLTERSSGQYANTALIWPSSNTAGLHVLSELMAAATDPTGAAASGGFGLAPRANLFIDTKTTDSILQSVGIELVNLGYTTTSDVEGINIVVGNNISSTTSGRVTGIEVDIQGQGSASFIQGYEVQVYANLIANCGLRLIGNAIGGTVGKYIDGIDLSGGTYVSSAIKIGNNQQIKIYDSGGTAPTSIYMDSSDVMQILTTTTSGNMHIGATGNNYTMLALSGSTFLNRPSGGAIHFREANGSDQVTIGAGGTFVIASLPTSDPHVVGQLWNSSGTVHVSAG